MIRYWNMRALVFSFCTGKTKMFGLSSEIGGTSSQGLYEQYANKFQNNDLENFKKKMMQVDAYEDSGDYALPGVNVITTEEECLKCMEVLMRNPGVVAAWDTETIDLDIKQEAPVGKGKILCASFFAGPQFNFGRGPRVFIDNFGKNAGLINFFKPYLESDKHLKVWHNYGFDRHLFYNHGINVRGFAGDTMHMARLYDSGKMGNQYSLAALTSQYKDKIEKVANKMPDLIIKETNTKIAKVKKDLASCRQIQEQAKNAQIYKKYYLKNLNLIKKKMEDIFKRKKILKSGKEGVTHQYPNTLTLHTNVDYLKQWINYSVLDSETTFYLRETLKNFLQKDKIDSSDFQVKDNWELYQKYWLPFGEILTDIEREGMQLDLQHMKNILQQAKADLFKKEEFFINFLTTFQNGKNIDHFNCSSALQLQQLLFAPCEIKRPEKTKEQSKLEGQDQQLKQSAKMSQEVAYEPSAKRAERKQASFTELVKTFKVDNKFGTSPKKVNMEIMGLGLPYNKEKVTPLGLPSADQAALDQLAGDPDKQKYGTAYTYFKEKGNPEFGIKLCHALRTLIEYGNIQTLIKSFIQPLPSYADPMGRIHCSLNINTETGRLSCRKPNIQNQPALDKDIYKIRKAFVAGKGKKLIVADYGQLQLRVLAHLTNCKAMIEAFKEGGDFHSRTAIGMYSYIKKDIQQGKILLEWDKSKGDPPVPLLKDKYAAQRKKAKTVNFSIAYGKSAIGFAADWNCTVKQAQQVIKCWFSDRPQVKKWQQDKQKTAQRDKKTHTLLGRVRRLDRFFRTHDKKFVGMWKRRAINTPIQGGAADIVIAAMVKISRNEKLKELGWKLLMQIHDELILEGPQESAKQALQLMRHDMQHPFHKDLLVALEVDAKIGNNWYECK